MFWGIPREEALFRQLRVFEKGGTNALVKTKGLPPGTPTPESGQYKSSKTGEEVTSTKGNPLPPGPAGTKYDLVDKTKHKGN
jgi:hypothetical protein